jgi:transposase InsO family protein
VFLDTVYKLHGLPQVIVTDRDPLFTSIFWQELIKKLGITLNFSTAYHPQTDGQTERLNQYLECYLRCMIFEKPKEWEKWVPLAEWWYNTNFHTSIQTIPFEALYGYPFTVVIGHCS